MTMKIKTTAKSNRRPPSNSEINQANAANYLGRTLAGGKVKIVSKADSFIDSKIIGPICNSPE